MHTQKKNTLLQGRFLIIFTLLINALTWYYIISTIIDMMITAFDPTKTQILTAWVIHYIAVFIFGILGAMLSEKMARRKLLQMWIVLGAIVSCLPIFVSNTSLEFAFFVSFLLGIVFGFGMPSCLAYFADITPMEKRGKKSAIILLATNLVAALFLISLQIINSGIMYAALIATIWRGLGLLVFFWDETKQKNVEPRQIEHVSFLSILQNNAIVLYLATWLLFCLIDRFEKPILFSFFGVDFHNLLSIVEPVVGSISAVVGGVLADLIGRKRVAMYGFVALGIAYAMLGIMPTALFSWYFYILMDAIGAGFLWMVFILVLWGDLAMHQPKEKYYFVGSIPFFVSDIIRFAIPAVFTSEALISLAYATFSIASFFLFLAVIPLMYAPETLPEKKIRDRELKQYIDKAKKTKEKYT